MTREEVAVDGGGRRAQLTRLRIIRAAREVIAEGGLESVRIDEIAEAAGVGRSTFYLHFKSRAELANAIAVDEMDTLTDAWAELAHLDADDGAAVRGWLEELIARWDANRSLTVISIEYRTDQSKLASELVDVQFSASNAFIAELERMGVEPAGVALEEIRIGFMLVARFLYLHVSMQVPYDDTSVAVVAEHLRYALARTRG